jgi:hypothetical protein
MDGVPAWLRWIIVGAIGLSPILTFWMAGVLVRFLSCRQWQRTQRDAPVAADRSASTPEDETASDYRIDLAL